MARRFTPETGSIESVTHDGRGIVAIDGKKVFVSGALAGEEVRFCRRKRKRNYDEAELLEVLEPSADRIAARCAAFGTCGGCSLQHITDIEQRRIKQVAVADSLQRIGQVEPERWLDPIFDDSSDGSWNYRRRARLAVKDVKGKGRVLVGFRERHAPYITDMHRCEVLAAPADNLIDPLSDLVGSLSIRARLPQIELAVADNAVALVFRVLDPPTAEDSMRLIEFAKTYQVQVLVQPGGLDSIIPLYPQSTDALTYSLPDYDIEIEFDATDFLQVNAAVNRLMVSEVLGLLQPTEDHRVLDLYCGIGNFSLPLARHAKAVLGVEGEMHQVRRASQNARRNGLENCAFECADLGASDLRPSWFDQSWDRVLIDPPRCGARELVDRMHEIDAQRVVYVSCHPGTLARDAAILVNSAGYRFSVAGIIDMFPHTGHVESVAVFDKV